MERFFDSQLGEVKSLVTRMGGWVEQSLDDAVRGLVQKDLQLLARVHKSEEKINADHLAVDESCLALIAKQAPVAKDLRIVFSFIKMNADLERMGDQCVNLAHIGKDYLTRNSSNSLFTPVPNEIQVMAGQVRLMVQQCLDAFVREDLQMAKQVLLMDDDVDQGKKRVFEIMTQKIEERSADVAQCLNMILFARNLERLGDHATNIAEDVIFVSTGKDIRHGGKDNKQLSSDSRD